MVYIAGVISTLDENLELLVEKAIIIKRIRQKHK
jgi:hypothetical protein